MRAAVTGGERYDAVLLLGVLMYLQASGPVIDELAAERRAGRVSRPRGTDHDVRAVAPGGPSRLAGGPDRVRRIRPGPRSSTSKSAWAPPTRTGSWVSSRT
jgi:hypothetical protein